jgi:hypothetical protein
LKCRPRLSGKTKPGFPISRSFFVGGANAFTAINEYMGANPAADQNAVIQKITALYDLMKKPVGVIELVPDLDIETVTEIFIRINSKGVELSQADFAMSKIAANEPVRAGQELRKAIDYFCHLAVAPEYLNTSGITTRTLPKRNISPG